MTSSEEQNLLINLSELLARDLTTVDDETLIAGVHDAETAADTSIKWSGQLIAELKKRRSWSELVRLTGMPQTTLHNRARPYRAEEPGEA